MNMALCVCTKYFDSSRKWNKMQSSSRDKYECVHLTGEGGEVPAM